MRNVVFQSALCATSDPFPSDTVTKPSFFCSYSETNNKPIFFFCFLFDIICDLYVKRSTKHLFIM